MFRDIHSSQSESDASISDSETSEWEGDLEAELLEAARSGDADQCKALIEHDADINHADQFGMTALHYAAEGNQLECVAALLDYLEIDATLHCDESPASDIGGAPLHLAAAAGHLNIVARLLRNRHVYSEIDWHDECGYTALHEAMIEGHLDVASLLVDQGADINVTTGRDESAIEIPQGLSAIGLLFHKYSIDQLDSSVGELFLKLLNHEDFNPYVESMLDEGIWGIDTRDLDDEDGASILHIALETGAADCIPILLQILPAEVINHVIQHKPPVYAAVRRTITGNDDILRLFLQCDKYDPTILCDGQRPLAHVLVQLNKLHLLEMLARHPKGGDFNIRDNYGNHILDIEMSNGERRVLLNRITTLKKEGIDVKFDPHAKMTRRELAQKRTQYAGIIDEGLMADLQVNGYEFEPLEEGMWAIRHNPEVQALIPEFSEAFQAHRINDPSLSQNPVTSFLDKVIEISEGDLPYDEAPPRLDTLGRDTIVQLAALPEFDRPRPGDDGSPMDPLSSIRDDDELLGECQHAQRLYEDSLINTTTGGPSSLPSEDFRREEYYEPLLRLEKLGKKARNYSQTIRNKVNQLNQEFAETGTIDSEKYGEFVIANYRGVNLNRTRIPKEERYEKLQRIKERDYFCDMINENFPDLMDEGRRAVADKIIQFTREILTPKAGKPIRQTWHDKKQRFDYPIHFILQRFSNNKDNNNDPDAPKLPAFSDDIWPELMKQMPGLKKMANQYGIPLVKSFIIAFAKHPRHPIRYVLGKSALKLYRSERMDGRARNDGSGNKYRLLGGLIVMFSSIDEYMASCPLDINQAYAQGYVRAHSRVRNEIEVDFPGYVPKERIEDVLPVFLPSLKMNGWIPEYKDFFGLSKTKYNNRARVFYNSKRSDDQHRHAKNKLREDLIEHFEQLMLDVAVAKAHLKGKILLCIGPNGKFSLIPENAAEHHTEMHETAESMYSDNKEEPFIGDLPKGMYTPLESRQERACPGDCVSSSESSDEGGDQSENGFESTAGETIGPRYIDGWVLCDVNDKGNCYYDAIAHQMHLKQHPFLQTIPEGTLPRDSIRLLIQGRDFNDREWADFPEIATLIHHLNVAVGIIDTRDPEQKIVYYYTDGAGEVTHTQNYLEVPEELSIFRLAFTGNHYLSVVRTPEFRGGQVITQGLHGVKTTGKKRKRSPDEVSLGKRRKMDHSVGTQSHSRLFASASSSDDASEESEVEYSSSPEFQ